MTVNEAVRVMTLSEYRLWWYRQVKVTPPFDGERLSVRQLSDERLIRDGYKWRRHYLGIELAPQSPCKPLLPVDP